MPLPGMAQTFQNITEYSAPKQSMKTCFGSFMHINCQLSCIFTFFFQKVKDQKKNLYALSKSLQAKTSTSIVLLAYLSFLQCLDISSREDGIYLTENLAIRGTMQLEETYTHQ